MLRHHYCPNSLRGIQDWPSESAIARTRLAFAYLDQIGVPSIFRHSNVIITLFLTLLAAGLFRWEHIVYLSSGTAEHVPIFGGANKATCHGYPEQEGGDMEEGKAKTGPAVSEEETAWNAATRRPEAVRVALCLR